MMYVNWPDVIEIAEDMAGATLEQRVRDFIYRAFPPFVRSQAESGDDETPYLVHCEDPVGFVTRCYDKNTGPRCPEWIAARDATIAAARSGKPMMHIADRGILRDYYYHDQRDVIDYLRSLDDEALDKLPSMTWAQVLKKSEDWHAKLARQKAKGVAGDEGTSDRLESADGHYWVRLVTQEALKREGSVMGHCVGQGSYDEYTDYDIDEGGIWSLRDREGRSVLTAEVSAEISHKRKVFKVEEYEFEQIKGAKNRDLIASDLPHVHVLRKLYDGFYHEAKVSDSLCQVHVETTEKVKETDGSGKRVWAWEMVYAVEDGTTRRHKLTDPILPQLFIGKDGAAFPDDAEPGSIAFHQMSSGVGSTMHALSSEREWVRLPFTGEIEIEIGDYHLAAVMRDGVVEKATTKSTRSITFARLGMVYVRVKNGDDQTFYDARDLAKPISTTKPETGFDPIVRGIDRLREYERAEISRRAWEMTISEVLRRPQVIGLPWTEDRHLSLEIAPKGGQEFITSDTGTASLAGIAATTSFEPKLFPSATSVDEGGEVLGHYKFVDPTPEMAKAAEVLGIGVKGQAMMTSLTLTEPLASLVRPHLEPKE